MIRRPPISTLTDTHLPLTTRCRSLSARREGASPPSTGSFHIGRNAKAAPNPYGMPSCIRSGAGEPRACSRQSFSIGRFFVGAQLVAIFVQRSEHVIGVVEQIRRASCRERVCTNV